jgi:radical SAM superfamily enzyme YgiQ (UPF0313 family)
MNILLVYPSYPDTFWGFRHALRFIGKKAAYPPVGLLTVAAMLPEHWNVRLVDTNLHQLEEDHLAWADYVFISAMSIQRDSALKVIDRCLKYGVKTVAGGPLFTSDYSSFPQVDHLVLGEAEVTLPRFLKDLSEGCPAQVYRTSEMADVNDAPAPRWNLINFDDYSTMCVQYSRGCPYDCEFCDITVLFGHKPRIKKPELVLAELDALYASGWRGGVFFIDDNFIGNKKALKHKLLPALIGWMREHKYPFSNLVTQTSIELADDDQLVAAMVEASFDKVFIGIETPDKQSLAECGKTHNLKSDMLSNVKKLQSSGIQVHGGFILGFDNDSEDVFSRMSQFINESGIVTSMVGLLNAPIGTRLYKRMVSEHRMHGQISGDNTDCSINFTPKMDYKVLIDGYRRVLEEIYQPDAYYRRVKKFLGSYKITKKLRGGVSLENLRGLVLSVYHIGLRSKVRKHFWKLIGWTCFRRPRLLPLAITMAIYGEHFMRHYQITVE